MGLVSQAKREAKRLHKDIQDISNLHNEKTSYDKFLRIRDLFYKIKGYKNYDNFSNIIKQKESENIDKTLITQNDIVAFNEDILISNEDIKLLNFQPKKVKSKTAPTEVHHIFDYNPHSSLVLLENDEKYLFKTVSQKHVLFITDNEELSRINSNVLSVHGKTCSIDPLNPLIGDLFSIKYFFGSDIYLWINEILVFIKKNNYNIDIKNLDKLFSLPKLINYIESYSEEFSKLKEYLSNIFNDLEISLENISQDVLETHFKYCLKGLSFAKIIKDYDCFQNNPNCDFYAGNQSLSVLLSDNNSNEKIVSDIFIHNIFQTTSLINLSHNVIFYKASCSFIKNINAYSFRKIIFSPYIDDIKNKSYTKIIDNLFKKSEYYLFKIDMNFENEYLPLSYIDKVSEVKDFPVKYRQCKNFLELKEKRYLFINTPNKLYHFI